MIKDWRYRLNAALALHAERMEAVNAWRDANGYKPWKYGSLVGLVQARDVRTALAASEGVVDLRHHYHALRACAQELLRTQPAVYSRTPEQEEACDRLTEALQAGSAVATGPDHHTVADRAPLIDAMRKHLEIARAPEFNQMEIVGFVSAADAILEHKEGEVAALRAALKIAQQGLTDWVLTYADDMSDPADVRGAHDRMREAGGTLGYIAGVQEQITQVMGPEEETAHGR